jgi:phosphorylase kinase alpha/beta subunit
MPSNGSTKSRPHDAAFILLYPLDQVDAPEVEDQILRDVQEHLAGHIGIRRYNGYLIGAMTTASNSTPELAPSDFSEDISNRDRLLSPGFEAQRCLFDPILACIHGCRYQQSGRAEELEKQLYAIRARSANQLAPAIAFPRFAVQNRGSAENGGGLDPDDITPPPCDPVPNPSPRFAERKLANQRPSQLPNSKSQLESAHPGSKTQLTTRLCS